MMSDREKMIAALKKDVVHPLRQQGFSGSFPHFRRFISTAIQLLTFQFDKWGGGFVVEVAVCDPDGVTLHWGVQVPPSKVTTHDLHPSKRKRLDAPGGGEWFRYDTLPGTVDRFGTLAKTTLCAINSQAAQWWDSQSRRP